jgi:hypothetical protein
MNLHALLLLSVVQTTMRPCPPAHSGAIPHPSLSEISQRPWEVFPGGQLLNALPGNAQEISYLLSADELHHPIIDTSR